MVPDILALITAVSNPNPCRRIQKVRRTPLRTSERIYRTITFDVLQHGKFTDRKSTRLNSSHSLHAALPICFQSEPVPPDSEGSQNSTADIGTYLPNYHIRRPAAR